MKAVKVWFCDFWHPEEERHIRQNPLFRLLARAVSVELSRVPEYLFFSWFGKRHLDYDCVRVCYSGENRRVDPRVADYWLGADYGDGERSFRLPLYRLYAEYDALAAAPRPVPPEWNSREFCSLVVSEPAARERIAFFEQLSRLRPVASGGRVLNNVGGPVADKLAFIARYRFHIAFENSSYPGYTTEKLLQALAAGCIPIYWGNPRIAEDFDAAAFVNCHDFDSWDAVIGKVEEIDRSPELQRIMLEAPVFPEGQEPSCCREENIAAAFHKVLRSPPIIPAHVKRRNRPWLRRLTARLTP